jgi:hypothetical protein
MGKGSSILATIALVIGLGVGTFVIYDNFIAIPPTTADTPPQNQWYDFNTGSNLVPGSEAWGTLSTITIDFNVSSGQTVYFLFIGQVNFDDSSTPGSYVEIILSLNGISVQYPRIYVRRYNLDSAEGYRMSVSLQHYNSTMTPGDHTIEVLYRGDSTSDSVREYSLFVQTFN